jgi:hypothetical protein
MEPGRVSLREMARRRGCTHGAVQKAISDGRIPASAVERDKRGRIASIDFAAATAAWNANTDVDQAARTPGGTATVTAAGESGQLPLEGAPSSSAAPKPAEELRTASVKSKGLQNQLLEIELQKELGVLVSVEDHREVSLRRYRAIRDKLLTVPDRVADVLAAERDAARVHSILTTELELMLNELADAAAAQSAELAPRAAA